MSVKWMRLPSNGEGEWYSHHYAEIDSGNMAMIDIFAIKLHACTLRKDIYFPRTTILWYLYIYDLILRTCVATCVSGLVRMTNVGLNVYSPYSIMKFSQLCNVQIG